MSDEDETLRGRVQRTGEDVIGKLAQDLLSNPVMTGALQRALETREKATQAQEVAMGALNLPSAADVERLTRRVRSVSQRLEAIEDAIDRLDDRLADVGAAAAPPSGGDDLAERLGRIESALETLVAAQGEPASETSAPAKRAPAKRATRGGGAKASAASRSAGARAGSAAAKARAAGAQAAAAERAAEDAADAAG